MQGAPPGLPWEGLGVQYRKRLQAQDLAQSEASLEHSVVPERQEESAAASSAAPATKQQPEGPPPPKVKLVPRPPDEPPAGHHLRQPPYPAPTQRPEEFILPRDRQQVPQHPSGPPRSARLDQARSKPAADRSRGRATARGQDLQQPAAQEPRSRRRRRHHSEGDHSKGKGARRRRTSHRRTASLTSRSPENKSPIREGTKLKSDEIKKFLKNPHLYHHQRQLLQQEELPLALQTIRVLQVNRPVKSKKERRKIQRNSFLQVRSTLQLGQDPNSPRDIEGFQDTRPE